MLRKFITMITLAASAFLLASCTQDFGAGTYAGASAGQAQTVRYGSIVQAQPVTIASQGDQGIGMLAGAGAGAVLGSRIGGGGTAHALGGIAGALAGGAAGNAIGKSAGKQQGMQYIVKLNTGSTLSVVQGMNPILHVGQSVMILTGSDSRDRVVANNSVQPQQQYHNNQGRYQGERRHNRRRHHQRNWN